jgi:hypothetical protein
LVLSSNQNLTSTGFYAFQSCSSLTNVSIPNNITTISAGSFQSSGLTSVVIPNSVTSIEQNAFSNCSGLTSVTIPISVTYMGNYVFESCAALSTIYCYTTYTVMNVLGIISAITIPVTVHARISDGTWNNVSTLGTENTPKQITVIRDLQ